MSLRSKVVALVVAVFIVSASAEYAVRRSVIQPSFIELERTEAIKDLERCREALSREIEHLVVQCSDWAQWDDTYAYIVDRNEAYASSTLVAEALGTAQLNLVYYINLQGEVVWSKVLDLETLETLDVPVFPPDRVDPDHFLLSHETTDDVVNGVIMTDGGPMLIASLPILTTEQEGPIRGALVMGRFLNEEQVRVLAEQTRIDLRIWPIPGGTIPDDDRVALGKIGPETPMVVEERGKQALAVYTTFNGLDGQPLLLMRAELPREISAKGLAAMRFATLSLVTVGVVILILLIVLLQRVVVGPVVSLTAHATKLGTSRDLDSRLDLKRGDEIGTLAGEFDRMVGRLAESQGRLVEVSRRAGMAEIASGVLHNVGNVLNSVNVSAERAAETVRSSDVVDVVEVANLLQQHATDLGDFVTTDEKGRILPAYLKELGDHLITEQATVIDELQTLLRSVDHIGEVVQVQQSYAKRSAALEPVAVIELVEDALRINQAGLDRHRVRIVREFGEVPIITVDKHAVLQILINLINNAKYALDEVDDDGAERLLTIRVGVSAEDGRLVRVDVIDNGVGIAAENLTRIFAHGFTTRESGHGFGLHTGALAAKTLGGSLNATSPGLGRGATVTLELPLEPAPMADAA